MPRPPNANPPAYLSPNPPVPTPEKVEAPADDPLGVDPTRYGDWTLKGIAVDPTRYGDWTLKGIAVDF